MAWKYCRKCGEGMTKPTVRQILTEEWNCESCGAEQQFEHDERNSALEELLDRIEEIEKRLNQINTAE